jgi:hypothetical protein
MKFKVIRISHYFYTALQDVFGETQFCSKKAAIKALDKYIAEQPHRIYDDFEVVKLNASRSFI